MEKRGLEEMGFDEGLDLFLLVGEKLADPDSLSSEERKEFRELLSAGMNVKTLTCFFQLCFGAKILSRGNIREKLEKGFGEEDAKKIFELLPKDEQRHIEAQEMRGTDVGNL